MTPDAGLKSTPSTSKPSEEDAQPHDDDDHYLRKPKAYVRFTSRLLIFYLSVSTLTHTLKLVMRPISTIPQPGSRATDIETAAAMLIHWQHFLGEVLAQPSNEPGIQTA